MVSSSARRVTQFRQHSVPHARTMNKRTPYPHPRRRKEDEGGAGDVWAHCVCVCPSFPVFFFCSCVRTHTQLFQEFRLVTPPLTQHTYTHTYAHIHVVTPPDGRVFTFQTPACSIIVSMSAPSSSSSSSVAAGPNDDVRAGAERENCSFVARAPFPLFLSITRTPASSIPLA